MNTKRQGGAVRIGLVASRFNQFIVDQLIAGAHEGLSRRGLSTADTTLVWVPGAFELPLAAEHLARSGQFSAIIALGAVIRGGTPHFDYVAGECAAGLGRVALDHGIPVMFGVLTTDTIEQALERAGTGGGNKGFDVAIAALDTIEALQNLAQDLGRAGDK
jgi:6,7-dimethyl-8-ribityllumazine synthase